MQWVGGNPGGNGPKGRRLYAPPCLLQSLFQLRHDLQAVAVSRRRVDHVIHFVNLGLRTSSACKRSRFATATRSLSLKLSQFCFPHFCCVSAAADRETFAPCGGVPCVVQTPRSQNILCWPLLLQFGRVLVFFSAPLACCRQERLQLGLRHVVRQRVQHLRHLIAWHPKSPPLGSTVSVAREGVPTCAQIQAENRKGSRTFVLRLGDTSTRSQLALQRHRALDPVAKHTYPTHTPCSRERRQHKHIPLRQCLGTFLSPHTGVKRWTTTRKIGKGSRMTRGKFVRTLATNRLPPCAALENVSPQNMLTSQGFKNTATNSSPRRLAKPTKPENTLTNNSSQR